MKSELLYTLDFAQITFHHGTKDDARHLAKSRIDNGNLTFEFFKARKDEGMDSEYTISSY